MLTLFFKLSGKKRPTGRFFQREDFWEIWILKVGVEDEVDVGVKVIFFNHACDVENKIKVKD